MVVAADDGVIINTNVVNSPLSFSKEVDRVKGGSSVAGNKKDHSNMTAAAAVVQDDGPKLWHKTYSIRINLNVKRTPQEIDFVDKESARLHNLIATSERDADWARKQIERIHKMVLMPNVDQVKDELQEAINDEDAKATSKGDPE